MGLQYVLLSVGTQTMAGMALARNGTACNGIGIGMTNNGIPN